MVRGTPPSAYSGRKACTAPNVVVVERNTAAGATPVREIHCRFIHGTRGGRSDGGSTMNTPARPATIAATAPSMKTNSNEVRPEIVTASAAA